MSPLPLNPFRPTRWEHQREGYQLIWFTEAAKTLAEDKSSYVRGSRGSGKTTLLKSICWEDLSTNSSLRLQRKLADFRHIGVYVRFPDHINASVALARWEKLYPNAACPELEFYKFFSLIVELACAERALTACHELRLLEQLYFSPSQELVLVEEILQEFPSITTFASAAPRTFMQLAAACRNLVRRMNEASGRGYLDQITDLLPLREPCELLSFLTTRLSEAMSFVSSTNSSGMSFKFCLDDCEVLSLHQQKTINTLVRLSRHPIAWVISYVGAEFEATDTFLYQQPLTDADRRIISLDRRKDSDFKQLCQAVVSLRLLFSVSVEERGRYNKPIEQFFSLDTRFGLRDINDTMAAIISRSSSPLAERLRRCALVVRDFLGGNSTSQNLPKSHEGPLPLYQTYTLLLWRGREDAFKTVFDEEDEADLLDRAALLLDSRFEAWIRRKQRAALLHFASSLGFRKIPFGGSNIIVSLADGSVRDFLEIVGSIFESYAKRHKLDPSDFASLDRFAGARTQIAWDIQTDGIVSASSSYLDGVSARSERETDGLYRLVLGLGQFTSLLQSNPNDPGVLGRAERGVFVIRFDGQKSEEEAAKEQAVWYTLKRAEISGYLRFVPMRLAESVVLRSPRGGRIIAFRMHRRFAPIMRFSPRGAYEAVVVAPHQLWPLCDRGASISPLSWAEQMSKSSVLDVQQLTFSYMQPDGEVE